MNRHFRTDLRVLAVLVTAALVLTLTACSTPETAEEPAGEGPGAVVEAFYIWYLDNSGFDEETNLMHNVIDEATYRDQPQLSEDFIAEIDTLASSGTMTADPFLCAQDVPESFEVAEPIVTNGFATVLVKTSFENHSFEVELEEGDDGWKIVGVNCSL